MEGMDFGVPDLIVFFAFIVAVVAIGSIKGRGEDTSESYFLAGRGLSWWLIGFSLIAANISTEQFIGMSGSAANWLGLAIASYEWMAAITLVVVAFFFLPKFLRAGIYTIPEFLEYRYNEAARSIMALFMVLVTVFVTFSAVVYSGALTAKTLFSGQSIAGMEVTVTSAAWIIGVLAAVYVVAGGLKACAWADLIQGSALIVGGAIVLYFAMKALGAATEETIPALANIDATSAWGRFKELNADKLHMIMPRTDPEIPWTALVIGLWIPNFYYWGLNQYITQRTLGAHSLAEGQKGVVFAAALKLIIPFIIVFPGIIAFNLYSGEMHTEATDTNAPVLANFESLKADPASADTLFKFDADFAEMNPEAAKDLLTFNGAAAGIEVATGVPAYQANEDILGEVAKNEADTPKAERTKVSQKLIGYKYDSAFALLVKELIPNVMPGLAGFMIAALLGAVMSSLASMLNSASTIFTMDLYRKYLNPSAQQHTLVFVGRVCVVTFTVIGCFIAPLLDNPKFGGIFKYIQEFQGYISPGILAVFVFGLLIKKAPPASGVAGLLLNPVMYGILKLALPGMAFLDRMALSFFCVLAVMGVMTMFMGQEPKELPVNKEIALESSQTAKAGGALVVVATIILYVIFR